MIYISNFRQQYISMPRLNILIAAFCLILLSACSNNNSGTFQSFTTDKLNSQFFDIDIYKDTVLLTAKGATIKIPKGSLQADSSIVRLEIKEAYNIADMVLAGLTTHAGHEPLSSGGMIYINPAAGQQVTILQPLQVNIPSTYVQDGMQLYKGQADENGTIDWTEPRPLDTGTAKNTLATGRTIYMANCTSCHSIGKDATGPQLAYSLQRRNWAWLKSFTRNSAAVIATGDRYANCLYLQWGGTAMTSFPQLSDEEILALYKYIQYESEKYDPATIPDLKKCLDSCNQYERLRARAIAKREKLIAGNGALVTTRESNAVAANNGTQAVATPSDMVTANNAQSEYYRISITTFGWYNVDILMKGLPGFEESTLMVRMTGSYTENFNIYLIIPRDKIYVAGGLLNGKSDEYGFYRNAGQIPLPQGLQAYIMAIGESKGQLYYNLSPFTTSRDQELTVSMTTTTQQQLSIEIQKLSLRDMEVKIGESKNAEEIRKTDMELDDIEQLKPKGCYCGCGKREGEWKLE